jgi:hypothetical protein
MRLEIGVLSPVFYVLIYLGAAVTLLGVALLVMDWWEGPFVMTLGLTLLLLSRAIGPDDGENP